MRLFKRKLRNDSRGLSLVELICAVAILGAISTAIGGAMVVSANSYKRGTAEAELQKSSEFVANVIEGLIVDATDSVDFTGNVLTIDNTNVGGAKYTITFADGKLMYDEVGSGCAPTPLAENVTNFVVDSTDFNTSRKLNITIGMVNEDGRTISTVYNIMSRNNPLSSTLTAIDQSAVIDVAAEVTLEPNQEYVLPVVVIASGAASTDYTLVNPSTFPENDTSGNTQVYKDPTTNNVVIKIGKDEKGGPDGQLSLTIRTVATKPDGTPLDERTVPVKIRRVLGLNMELKTVSGTKFMKNSVYEVQKPDSEARFVAGTNLPQVPGAPYDYDYKDPYGAVWSYKLINSAGTALDANAYVQEVAKADDVNPYYRFTLKEDLPVGATLQIWATAKHPKGMNGAEQTNKTGVEYDDVADHVDLKRGDWYNYNSDFLRGDDHGITISTNFDWPSGWSSCNRTFICRKVRLDASGNVIEVLSDWSEPLGVGDYGTPSRSMFLRPGNMTSKLDPNYAYEISVMTEFKDNYGNIMWPKDDIENSMEQSVFTFTIPDVSLVMNQYTHGGGGGTVPASKATGWNYDDRLAFNAADGYNEVKIRFDLTAAHASKFCNTYMQVKVQKMVEVGVWEDVDSPLINSGSIQIVPEYSNGAEGYLIVRFQNNKKWVNGSEVSSKGVYKAEIGWKDGCDIINWFGDSTYTKPGSDKGILYLEFK